MDDLISRKAAIEALGEEPEVWTGKDEYAQGLNNQWHYDVNALKTVPSAQRDCNICKYRTREWDEEPCDGCTRNDSKYEPDNGWIPVDKGMPKDGTDCLITYTIGCVEIATFVEDLYEFDEYNFRDMRGVAGWVYFDDEYGYQEYSGVMAWMPLPDPYKEEE